MCVIKYSQFHSTGIDNRLNLVNVLLQYSSFETHYTEQLYDSIW